MEIIQIGVSGHPVIILVEWVNKSRHENATTLHRETVAKIVHHLDQLLNRSLATSQIVQVSVLVFICVLHLQFRFQTFSQCLASVLKASRFNLVPQSEFVALPVLWDIRGHSAI